MAFPMADMTSKGGDDWREGGQSKHNCFSPSKDRGRRPYPVRNLRLGLLFTAGSCLLLCIWNHSLKNCPASHTGSTDPSGSLETVLKSAAMDDNKTVIITTLNDAWAEPGSIFDVFLESFRVGNGTLKLLDHLVVVALDKKAFDRCVAVHRHCFALATKGKDFSGEANFMTADYLEMMWRRIDFLRVVLRMGYDFVFTDTDIMWLRSPLPHFYPDGDFQIACDIYQSGPADRTNLPNGGFTYVRSNGRTAKFYEFWYRSRKDFPGKHDQDVLNMIKFHPYVSGIGLQMRFLDTAYMGGFCQLSGDLDRICTMHANCCVGLDNKIHDLSTVLDDWRKYMLNGTGKWTVPNHCKESFGKPHKPHKDILRRSPYL